MNRGYSRSDPANQKCKWRHNSRICNSKPCLKKTIHRKNQNNKPMETKANVNGENKSKPKTQFRRDLYKATEFSLIN